MRAHLLRRQERGGNGADRVPAIAMPGRTSQRGPRMPTDPDRRVRLLHREWFAADIRILVKTTIEAGGRLGPELLEDRDPFISHRTARLEAGAVQRLELFPQPAGADT